MTRLGPKANFAVGPSPPNAYRQSFKAQPPQQKVRKLMEIIYVMLMLILGTSILLNLSYNGFYRNFLPKYSLHKEYEWGPSNFHFLDDLNGYMTSTNTSITTKRHRFWILNPKLHDRKQQEKANHLDSNGKLKKGSCLAGESTPDLQTPFAICRDQTTYFIFMYQNVIVEPSTSQKLEKRVVRIQAWEGLANTFYTNISGSILMQVHGAVRITPCTMESTYTGEPDACSAARSNLREKHILEYSYPVSYMGKTDKDLNVYLLPQDKTQSYLGAVINKGSRNGLDVRLRIVDGTRLFVDRHMISTLSIPSDLPKAFLIFQLVLAFALVSVTNRGCDLHGNPVVMPSNLIILSRMGISGFIVLQLAFYAYFDIYYLRIMVHLGGALRFKSMEMSCLLLSKMSSLGIFMILLPTQLIKFVNARKRCDRAYTFGFCLFGMLFFIIMGYNLSLKKTYANGLQCRAQSGIQFTCYKNASCCTEAPAILLEHLLYISATFLTYLISKWYMRKIAKASVRKPNGLNQFEKLCLGGHSSMAVIGRENQDVFHENHRYTSPYAVSWMGFCKLDDETLVRRKDFYIALIQTIIIAIRLNPHEISLTMTIWSLSKGGTRVEEAAHKLNSDIPRVNWDLHIKPLR